MALPLGWASTGTTTIGLCRAWARPKRWAMGRDHEPWVVWPSIVVIYHVPCFHVTLCLLRKTQLFHDATTIILDPATCVKPK
jgi:hypothetical protein